MAIELRIISSSSSSSSSSSTKCGRRVPALLCAGVDDSAVVEGGLAGSVCVVGSDGGVTAMGRWDIRYASSSSSSESVSNTSKYDLDGGGGGGILTS
jgi:hypothetical protein